MTTAFLEGLTSVVRCVILRLVTYVKRKCKTRIEIVGAGSPRPQSVRVGFPNPYEDLVAVARPDEASGSRESGLS